MHSSVYFFALGHLATDWSQGAIPALLPYFIARLPDSVFLTRRRACWFLPMCSLLLSCSRSLAIIPIRFPSPGLCRWAL